MTDADYADDLVLPANTLAQAESLQHSLEQETLASTGTQTKQYMCFKRKGTTDHVLNEKEPWTMF